MKSSAGQSTQFSAAYVGRFFLLSAGIFLLYPVLLPAYATLLVTPITVAITELHAMRDGVSFAFEWRDWSTIRGLASVNFAPLCQNTVVLSALILALQWPLAKRIRTLAIASMLLFLLNELHLALIVLYNYHVTFPSPDPGFWKDLGWRIVSIAYHQGRQVGTMLFPFALFLLLLLRQAKSPANGGAFCNKKEEHGPSQVG